MTERTIFLAVLELAEPAQRAASLERAWGGDRALSRQVETLLAAHDRPGSFLNVPVLAPLSPPVSAVPPAR